MNYRRRIPDQVSQDRGFAFRGDGYTLAAALIMIAILSIFMALALPLWSHIKQREMEEELIFRGKEYVEAIARYQQKFHTYPPDLETLEKQKFIRRLYKDPMTESGKWKILHPDSLVQTGAAGEINAPGGSNQNNEDQVLPDSSEVQSAMQGSSTEDENPEEEPEVESAGPVVGVVSRSKKTSLRVYNNQNSYNKWVFSFALTDQPGSSQGQPGGGKQKKPDSGKQSPSDQKSKTAPQSSDQEKD